jgi:hypothetical protein
MAEADTRHKSETEEAVMSSKKASGAMPLLSWVVTALVLASVVAELCIHLHGW